MKILTAQQTRDADAYTIESEPIASIDLMERASRKCFDWLKSEFVNNQFSIFCGIGNNGGDGLAIARMFHQNGNKVEVFVVHFSENHTKDFDINLKRFEEIGLQPQFLSEENYQFTLDNNAVIIDAIFGSGLTRPIGSFIAEIVKSINSLDNTVVSIDMPSGLFSESNLENDFDTIIKANSTLTFQQPKLTQLFPENYQYVGDFVILDIDLHKDFIDSMDSKYFYVTSDMISSVKHQRTKFSHKGSYGHALLISGSKGKMGAAVLAANACLRTGVGLLTVHVPKVGVEIMQTSVPEAMCSIDDEDEIITQCSDISQFDVVGVGPGLGKAKETEKALKFLIQNASKPMVIDADALNIIADNKTWLSFLPPLSILTPHPKEFERLVGKWSNDEERLQLQIETSIKNNVIIVLKGANTSISIPSGNVYFNSTGNPGMATGGSGDVLTGIVTSLLAQDYQPHEAAMLGVYLHGLAGDFALNQQGENSLIASDIVNNISKAYQTL